MEETSKITIFSNFVLNFPTLYFRGLKFSNFVDFKLLEHFENYFKESVWNEFYELVGDKYIKGELKKLQARMKETSQWNQPPKPKEAEDQKKSAKDSEEKVKSKKEEKKDTKAQKKAEKKAEKAEKKAEKKSHKNEREGANKDKKKKKQKDFIPAETG